MLAAKRQAAEKEAGEKEAEAKKLAADLAGALESMEVKEVIPAEQSFEEKVKESTDLRAKMEARVNKTKVEVAVTPVSESSVKKPEGMMNKHDRAAATRDKINKAKAKAAQTEQKTRELEAKKRRELQDEQKRKDLEKVEDERRKKRAMEKVASGNKKLLDHAHGITNASPGPDAKKPEVKMSAVASNIVVAPPPVASSAPPAKRDSNVCYEMSPPRDDSEDESDDEAPRVRKKIPQWATKKELPVALEAQKTVDPDLIFHHVNSCDLGRIFSNPRKNARFDRRGESGVWDKDGLQMKEVEQYRRMNGWATNK